MTQRIRKRRSAAYEPEAPAPQDSDRRYTGEDYAIPDEWAADGGYLPEEDPASFAFAGEDAFLPEEDAFLPVEDEPVPVSDEWGYAAAPFSFAPDALDEDDDPLAEDLLTDEERAELSRSRWSLLAGLADFAGVIIGTAVILLLVMLLVSLINWLMSDISQTFTLMQMRF